VEAALKEEPRRAELWQVLGLLYRATEDLRPAVKAFDRASLLAPENASIALGRAHATLEAGLPATSLFKRAMAIAPHKLTAAPGLAASEFADGGIDNAIELLDGLLKSQPGWFEGQWLLSRLKWMRGEQESAIASVERAVVDSPRDMSLWRQGVFILMHAGRYEQALDLIARARAAAGEQPALLLDEAACLTETWQLPAADRAFAKLPPAQDVGQAVYEMRHALRSGAPERAAERALQLAAGPSGHMVLPYLSLAWRVLGDSRWSWLEGDERLIGVYDVANSVPHLKGLASLLRRLHKSAGQPLEQSVRAGSQTDGPLLSRIDPTIRRLRRWLTSTISEHLVQMPPWNANHPLLALPRNRPLRLASSWSIRLQGNGYHVNHVHPAGWLSSAFYVTLPPPEQAGSDQAGWLVLGEPPKELGLDLPPIRIVEPKPGRLVLFPSTMWHGTRPIPAGERMTVAFDVARPR
jgi:tetratricopeptide (TPR) repeat protein